MTFQHIPEHACADISGLSDQVDEQTEAPAKDDLTLAQVEMVDAYEKGLIDETPASPELMAKAQEIASRIRK